MFSNKLSRQSVTLCEPLTPGLVLRFEATCFFIFISFQCCFCFTHFRLELQLLLNMDCVFLFYEVTDPSLSGGET